MKLGKVRREVIAAFIHHVDYDGRPRSEYFVRGIWPIRSKEKRFPGVYVRHYHHCRENTFFTSDHFLTYYIINVVRYKSLRRLKSMKFVYDVLDQYRIEAFMVT